MCKILKKTLEIGASRTAQKDALMEFAPLRIYAFVTKAMSSKPKEATFVLKESAELIYILSYYQIQYFKKNVFSLLFFSNN